MFKEIGQFASLMKNLPKIKEEVERFQHRLATIIGEGDAGGGMVKTRVNGKMEVLACTISEEALKLDDREMLEDLIRAAMNQALERVRNQVTAESQKMAADLGITVPPGMSLPGLPG